MKELVSDCPVGQPSLNEAFGPAREVQPVSNLEHSLGFIEQWLDACNESHRGCIQPSSYLPDRVISLKGDDSPVLIDTNCVMSGKYITVSHSWGTAFGKKPLMTTKENMDKHKQGIPWEVFPALFQDFLAIASKSELPTSAIIDMCGGILSTVSKHKTLFYSAHGCSKNRCCQDVQYTLVPRR